MCTSVRLVCAGYVCWNAQGVTEILPKHLKRLHLGDGDATFLRLLVAQVHLFT